MLSKSKSRRKIYNLLTGVNEVGVGGVCAVGSIEFADLQVATETITIGDYTVEFTASASDATADGTVADPLLVNIKGSLSLTLDELIVVLLAATGSTGAWGYLHPDDSDALSHDGTVLTITFWPGTWANSVTLAGDAGDETIVQPVGGLDAPTLSLDYKVNTIDTTGSTTNEEYYVLPDGEYIGQEVTLNVNTLAASDTPSVLGNFMVNTTANVQLQFDVAEEFVKLIWSGTYWKPVHTTSNEAYTASA